MTGKDGKRKWLPQAACIGGSVLLYLALTFAGGGAGPMNPDGTILREGYGGEDRQYEILVEGLSESGAVPVTVRVGARSYSEEEAEQTFWRLMDGMEEEIRGDNPSLMEVRQDLELPSGFPREGVRARWSSSDPEVLSSAGKLVRQGKEPREVVLTVELTDGVYESSYEIPVRILPPERTGEEQLVEEFMEELQAQDEAQKENPVLALPDCYQEHELRYQTKKIGGYSGILFLGILAAVLLGAKEQSGRREQEKRREKELLLDYADVLSKLMVLTGAGLTVRNAWERMVRDYEAGLAQGRLAPRAAYEEMRQTAAQMQSGLSEGEAYRAFGRRCKVQCYLKLSSLLDQNRKAGTKNLRAIFETEMADALEQRKNLARRLGEEAGTKLLLPLFLLLGIVMVMIMVPAMMTMG